MGTLRIELKEHHNPTPLFERGSPPRTFRGLGVFAEAGLLFCGIYLLMDAIASPLQANPAGVLASGTILGLAVVLFFFLIRPLSRPALSRRAPDGSAANATDATLTPFGNAIQTRFDASRVLEMKDDLPGPM